MPIYKYIYNYYSTNSKINTHWLHCHCEWGDLTNNSKKSCVNSRSTVLLLYDSTSITSISTSSLWNFKQLTPNYEEILQSIVIKYKNAHCSAQTKSCNQNSPNNSTGSVIHELRLLLINTSVDRKHTENVRYKLVHVFCLTSACVIQNIPQQTIVEKCIDIFKKDYVFKLNILYIIILLFWDWYCKRVTEKTQNSSHSIN